MTVGISGEFPFCVSDDGKYISGNPLLPREALGWEMPNSLCTCTNEV